MKLSITLFAGLLLIFLMPFVMVEQADAQSCVQPSSDLISWWPGDGNTDDVIEGNQGVLQNGATFGTGQVGQAFSFDGRNDFVSVPRTLNLDVGNQVTLDFWMRGDSDNHMNRCCQGLVTTDFYGIELSSGFGSNVGINFFIRTDSGASFHYTSDMTGGGYYVLPGQWHHVAGVYDGSNLRLYVDGQLKAHTSHTGNILPMLSNSYLSIGSEDGRTNCSNCNDRYFHGLIDEVGIYNRALSADEILAIFNAGSTGRCKMTTANSNLWILLGLILIAVISIGFCTILLIAVISIGFYITKKGGARSSNT